MFCDAVDDWSSFATKKTEKEFDEVEEAINDIEKSPSDFKIEKAKEKLRDLSIKVNDLARDKKKSTKSTTKKKNTVGFGNQADDDDFNSYDSGKIDFREVNSSLNYTLQHEGETKEHEAFSKEFEITLSRLAYNKIKTWCNLLDVEITAMGIVQVRNNTEFYVHDFYLFRQVVDKTECKAKDDLAMCELMDKIAKDENLKELGYTPSNIKCWWHSHNSMGVSPSSTDEQTSRNYATNDFLVTLISNHDDKFYSRVTIFKPFHIEFENIPVYIEDEGITEEFIEERKKKLRNSLKKIIVSAEVVE